jgi:hypothetical protein
MSAAYQRQKGSYRQVIANGRIFSICTPPVSLLETGIELNYRRRHYEICVSGPLSISSLVTFGNTALIAQLVAAQLALQRKVTCLASQLYPLPSVFI